MADGTSLPIAQVGVGDHVLATDPLTGLTTAEPVLGTIVGTGTKHLITISTDHGQVTATADHHATP